MHTHQRPNICYVQLNVTGYRYKTALVQPCFYSDTVRVSDFHPDGWVQFPAGSGPKNFSSPVTFRFLKKFKLIPSKCYVRQDTSCKVIHYHTKNVSEISLKFWWNCTVMDLRKKYKYSQTWSISHPFKSSTCIKEPGWNIPNIFITA